MFRKDIRYGKQFLNLDGKPIQFFICGVADADTLELVSQIEYHGGKVCSTCAQSEYVLTDGQHRIPMSVVNSGLRIYNIDWIIKCIENDSLVDGDEFELVPDDNEEDTPKQMEELLSPRKRAKYSEEDDEKILAFIRSHPHMKTAGTQLWMKMEKEVGINRTWQSLRSHYLLKAKKQAAAGEHTTTKRASASPAASPRPVDSVPLFMGYSEPLQENRAKNIIQYLMREYKVSERAVFKALLVYSGDVALAEEYLRKGPNHCTVKPWTKEDDANLLTNPSPEMFVGRDEQQIRRRIAFLEEIGNGQ